MVVGVTGGIGSGKSTACRFFRQRGRTVLSADSIAKILTQSDPRIRSAISQWLGPDIFDSRGRLDRRRLASIVFRHPRKLQKLNSIIHPLVLKDLQKRIRVLPPHKRKPFVVVESALIFEAGLEDWFDVVVLIHAPLETRVKRALMNSNFSRAEILRRARNQIQTAKARLKADISISNSGKVDDLQEATRFVDNFLSKMT